MKADLPDLPQLGSWDLVEFRKAMVIADARVWHESPTAGNAEHLHRSVEQYMAADAAYHETILRIQAELHRDDPHVARPVFGTGWLPGL